MSNLPNFPLYIPTKGRADSRLTSKHLERMGVPHSLVIEEQEWDDYAAHVPESRLLVLDKAYQRDYETCDALGDSKSKGPGPARNFIWDHAIASGHGWHWVMDDNINGFYRFNRNLKVPCTSPAVFRVMEDFCQRYTNIAMAGPNYHMFVDRKHILPPFIVNTRIYSCNLIRNDVPFRWRGRYNEDTILSLDMMKAGWCTVQFNALLQYKVTTQTLGGGNTAEFYAEEGTRPKSQMQVDVHPDVSKIAMRFGRVHHHVNYGVFDHGLIRRTDIEIPTGVDNYGMDLAVDPDYVPRGLPRGAVLAGSERQPGKPRTPPRDGDKRQARRRVQTLIQNGTLPRPEDVSCVDCGDAPGREYDHHLGYGAAHHEDVEALCAGCHHAREAERAKAPA